MGNLGVDPDHAPKIGAAPLQGGVPRLVLRGPAVGGDDPTRSSTLPSDSNLKCGEIYDERTNAR